MPTADVGAYRPGRTCRDEVLAAARELAARSSDGSFTVEQVVRLLTGRGTRYAERTIRIHVVSRMCVNAPANHATRYPDLRRDDRGRYRLNEPAPAPRVAMPEPVVVAPRAPADEEQLPEVPAGSSTVQRAAEAVILGKLSEMLGYPVSPKRLHLPGGECVDVDGVSHDPKALVEAWAHQGAAKPAQRNKVLADALKLIHVNAQLGGGYRRILCFSDVEAARVFQPTARTWYAAALKAQQVEVFVVELPPALRNQIVAAQRRQFR